MTALKSVIERATDLVTPSERDEQRLARVARLSVHRARKSAARYPESRDVVLGGSFAKGTWLPDNADVDVFVRLDTATPEDRFEEIGLAVGREAMRGYPRGKKYAQHPYTEATVEGVKVNVVPCYAVSGRKWLSAADRSPFHVDLVKSIPDDQKTQVRLLKRFMKAAGVYGAEIETQGFSGYVAEVLVIQEKSFVGVLRYFASFKSQGKLGLFSLPDPVDPARDLGAAVSGEKLGRFILACRDFLKRPAMAKFVHMEGQKHAGLRSQVVCLSFRHRKLSEDILWGELRRTLSRVVRHVEARGFKIARSMAASNNRDFSALLLVPEFDSLPYVEQRVGPTVDLEKETEAFISGNIRKAKLVWVDSEARVRLLQAREYTSLASLLSSTAKGTVGNVGASKELTVGMAQSGKVLSGSGLLTLAKSEKWLARGIAEIVSDAVGTRQS